MKRIASVPLLTLLFLASTGSALQAEEPWRKIYAEDGVSVWSRATAGSDLRQVKVETLAAVAIDKIWATIHDVEHYHQFIPNVAEARQLGAADGGVSYMYQRMAPPVVSQRDYTLKIDEQVNRETGLYLRSWVEANDRGPAVLDGVVRVQLCRGSWRLERIDPKRTKLTYTMHIDLGGSMPAWVFNMANKKAPARLLSAVVSRSRDPHWTGD